MKMARARKSEIDKALVIAGILDDLDTGAFPRRADGEFNDEDPTWFDEDNEDHLRALYDRLQECGPLWRVALGYAVLTDAKNAVIDPDHDYLGLHPRLREGLEALDHPARFWARRLFRSDRIDYWCLFLYFWFAMMMHNFAYCLAGEKWGWGLTSLLLAATYAIYVGKQVNRKKP